MKTEKESQAFIDATKEDQNELVINYLILRRVLGWLGIALPIILLVFSLALNGQLETSISNYYHTVFRDIFVAILCSMSLFLFTYRGYNKYENRVTNIAGILGFITAFAATAFKHDIALPGYDLVHNIEPYKKVLLEELANGKYKIIPSPHHDYIGYIHLICAASFFICFACISYYFFSKGDNHKKNAFFKVCGVSIFIIIASLVPCFFSEKLKIFYSEHHLIFWAEAICLWIFGAAWLVKGKTFQPKD